VKTKLMGLNNIFPAFQTSLAKGQMISKNQLWSVCREARKCTCLDVISTFIMHLNIAFFNGRTSYKTALTASINYRF